MLNCEPKIGGPKSEAKKTFDRKLFRRDEGWAAIGSITGRKRLDPRRRPFNLDLAMPEPASPGKEIELWPKN
jgi:hypothetical protein